MEDDAEEVRQVALDSLAQTRHPRWLSDGLIPLLEAPRTRRKAAEVLSRELDSRSPAHASALGPLLETLAAEQEPDVIRPVLAALKRLSGESRDAGGWRAWWDANAARWRAEQAFDRRPVRVRGRVVDVDGRPLADLQIILSHVKRNGHYRPRGQRLPAQSSTCLADEHGAIVNAGEDFTVFVSTMEGCQRLLRDGAVVNIHVESDTEVVELGELTVAPATR